MLFCLLLEAHTSLLEEYLLAAVLFCLGSFFLIFVFSVTAFSFMASTSFVVCICISLIQSVNHLISHSYRNMHMMFITDSIGPWVDLLGLVTVFPVFFLVSF